MIPTPNPRANPNGIGGRLLGDGRLGLLCPVHGPMARIAERTDAEGDRVSYWRCPAAWCRREGALREPPV